MFHSSERVELGDSYDRLSCVGHVSCQSYITSAVVSHSFQNKPYYCPTSLCSSDMKSGTKPGDTGEFID
jgi:hypothetical protein